MKACPACAAMSSAGRPVAGRLLRQRAARPLRHRMYPGVLRCRRGADASWHQGRVPSLVVMTRPDLPEHRPHGPRPGGAAVRRWATDVAIAVAVIAVQIGGTNAAAFHYPGHARAGILAYVLLALGGASHNISVINVQANTALHLMDRQPQRARSALVTINDVSKQALVELRSVLGVLRDAGETAPRAPAPGLARLGDLVENAAAAGLAVRIEEDGHRVPLPADVDLAAYRIVQEALTNSARHSGGGQATVRLGYGEAALEIEVRDDGPPRPPGTAAPGTTGPVNGPGNGIA